MPSFFIEQFGCRATQADGAALAPHLLDRRSTPPCPAPPASTSTWPFFADPPAPFHSFVGVPAAAGCAVSSGKILTGDIFEQNVLLSAPVLGGEGHHTRPTLKIQDGCDSRCSYCVIPFVR